MKIVIAGAGEVGSHLAKMLSTEANDITVIDADQTRLDALKANTDVITVTGNTASVDVLKKAEVDKADLFIAVNPSTSQNVNIVSSLLAKQLGSKRVTARINNEEYLSHENNLMFKSLGIDLMFYPEKIAANEIADLLRRTASTDALEFGRGKLQLSVFRIDEDSNLVDMKLIDFNREIATEAALQFRVVAIARGSETIMPKSETRFKYGDMVFIMSKREGQATLMQYIGKKNIAIKNIMILGGGPIAAMVARKMSPQVNSIKIIEMKKERCIQLSESTPDNVLVVHADGRNTDRLLEENIKDYDAFVAVTGSSETNILACVEAKKLGIERTIAEVENVEYIRLAEEMGVDAVINKKLITAGKIFKLTLSNKVRFIKYMSGTDAEIVEFIVAKDSKATKAPIKDLNFPQDAVIGGIIRKNEGIIAVGDTQIQEYDRVAVFAAPSAVKEVDKFFKGN
jgi:trk system potassium uptake protein TrkA